MVLTGEEVGSNIDTTGDGHIGGVKLLCEKGCIAQRKSTTKAKNSQLLGLQTYLMNLFVEL